MKRVEDLPDPRLLLEGPVVFDTMALTFMARTFRTQMLRQVFAARIKVPQRVMGELGDWASREAPIRDLFKPSRCMDVVTLNREQIKRVFARQRAWHGAAAIEADSDLDRGEAECLELCKSNGWPLVSHDHKALEYGPRQGTTVLCLVDVLLVCSARGLLKPTTAWSAYKGMCAKPVNMYECRNWQLSDRQAEPQFLSVASQLIAELADAA
jgi:predicted nucleic acid-binding protein